MEKDGEDPNSEKNGIWQDPRFSHLVSDPRFHALPKSARKVKIDKRFQSMFSDDKFRVKYSIDKYGRKINKSSAEDLKKYYELNSSTDEEQENEETQKEAISIAKYESSSENDTLEVEVESLPSNIIKKLNESGVDYARGEGRILTDSSSDEESSENEDELFIDHVWGELDIDAPKTDESTRRLAACNMDWDRIKAADIMVLCNSFLSPGGSILSVKIYTSEFGKQRIAEEEVHGPPELTRSEPTEDSDTDEELVKEVDSDAEEGDDYHMEKLRQYQLTRLKYYYAVIECDSVRTADKLYAECDGIEYESTATKLDLRFISDDTNFDDEPKDVCTELPDLSKYQPRLFTTTALQQAKVELTWDENNVERKELSDKLSSGKLTDVSDADLRKIVVYSSDEESDGEKKTSKDGSAEESYNPKDSISKYKSLLQEINKKESEKVKNKFEMEYSWGINVDNKKSTNKVAEKPKQELTPIEKALAKKSEKNKRRKEERRKRKQGSDKDDVVSSDDQPSDIDLNDPYFADEFANGDFEKPKKTPNKLKHSDREEDDDAEDEQKSKELQLLLDDCQDNEKQHFNLKQIQEAENETKSKKRRRKLKKSRQEINSSRAELEDNFKVNVKDDRFRSIYTSHMFNIDPTDPHYKKTKGMEAIIEEKFRRRQESTEAGNNWTEEEADHAPKRPRKNLENTILIKNIKNKIMQNRN